MRTYVLILCTIWALFGLKAYAQESDEPTDDIEYVEDWETYYAPDEGIDYDSWEALFAEQEPPRTPANAFKHTVVRGVGKGHKGIDYAAPCGTKVPALSVGVVSKAGTGSGYGKVVAVRVGKCTQIYAHLSSIKVSVGQKVKPGTLLGISGNTGRSRGRTGCHLHFEKCSQLYTEGAGGSKGKGKRKSKSRR